MGVATIQALGTVMQVAGTLKGARDSSKAASYNAALDEQNAAISLEQGEASALAQARTAARAIGNMRAAYGAAGVRSDTGSPLDALMASAAEAQLDVETIRYNAALKARGLQSSAELNRSRASAARSTGLYTAAGQAILGGVKAYAAYKTPTGVGTPIPVYGYFPPEEA